MALLTLAAIQHNADDMAAFYELTKDERVRKTEQIYLKILRHLEKSADKPFPYFFETDTYVRKAAYQSVGKIFNTRPELRGQLIATLRKSLIEKNEYIRQTTINAAGEIGMKNFHPVESFFDAGLFDEHYAVRNAVVGSIKKMGEKNPVPVLQWAKKYLHHPDKEIRREICHGIELRGRTHPEDILPLLKELQHDSTARVRNTLVHVLGQISYKKDCLEKVIRHIRGWANKDIVEKAVIEIIDVHKRYKNFAVLSQDEARKYIEDNI